MSQFDSVGGTPEDRWFAIRNDPRQCSGNIIALWHRIDSTHELAFGALNVEYFPHDENFIRTYKDLHAQRIDLTLVEEITQPEADTLIEIAEIPEILSDGTLHYLGKLRWVMNPKQKAVSFIDDDFEQTTAIGDVYVKVVLKRGITASLIGPAPETAD